MWSTDSEAKDASSLLSPYPRRNPRGTAIPIDRQASRTHYAQIYCCHFRTRVTSVVLYSFSQRRKWSDLTFDQVVVYRISYILAVHEQAFLEVVGVVQSLVHVITSDSDSVNSYSSAQSLLTNVCISGIVTFTIII